MGQYNSWNNNRAVDHHIPDLWQREKKRKLKQVVVAGQLMNNHVIIIAALY